MDVEKANEELQWIEHEAGRALDRGDQVEAHRWMAKWHAVSKAEGFVF